MYFKNLIVDILFFGIVILLQQRIKLYLKKHYLPSLYFETFLCISCYDIDLFYD